MLKEIILWLPTILYTTAYFGLILKYIKKGNLYIFMNLLGSIFIFELSFYHNSIYIMVVYLFWGACALYVAWSSKRKININ